MDFQEIMNSEYGPYVVNGAVGVGALAVGYLVGRISKKGRHKERMAELDVEKSRVDLDMRKQDNIVELKKMEYENEARTEAIEDSRISTARVSKLEDEDRERSYKFEEGVRERERVLEDRAREDETKERDRQYKLDLVSGVPDGIKDAFRTYAIEMNKYFDEAVSSENGVSADVMEARNEFRVGLVDRFMKSMDEDYAVYSEEYHLSGDDRKRIDELVDAKYPLNDNKAKAPEMPAELKKLVDLFS